MVATPREASAEERQRTALAGVTVARMRPRHLRSVMAIERVVYPRPWSASLFASEMRQPDTRRYVVALAPDEGGAVAGLLRRRAVVGYGGVLAQAAEAHITTVAVHPAHHRRKVASHVMLTLLRESIALGAHAATLEVRAANRGAQRLYAAFGFSPVGVRPNYYAETNEDAVIMWAHDIQGVEFATRLEEQAARLNLPGGSSGVPDLHVPWVKGRQGLVPSGPDDDAAGGARGEGY